jgi:hypothetical protein
MQAFLPVGQLVDGPKKTPIGGQFSSAAVVCGSAVGCGGRGGI